MAYLMYISSGSKYSKQHNCKDINEVKETVKLIGSNNKFRKNVVIGIQKGDLTPDNTVTFSLFDKINYPHKEIKYSDINNLTEF